MAHLDLPDQPGPSEPPFNPYRSPDLKPFYPQAPFVQPSLQPLAPSEEFVKDALKKLLPASSKPTNPKDAIATDKLPLHLVSPIVKAYQSIAHFLGNVKYGSWNWRPAGVRASVYKSAFERHVDAWWEGEKYDPTDGTPHLANAQACLNILIEAEETGVLTDDRPPSRKVELARVRSELEAMMPKIRARYADKRPVDHTISGEVPR